MFYLIVIELLFISAIINREPNTFLDALKRHLACAR